MASSCREMEDTVKRRRLETITYDSDAGKETSSLSTNVDVVDLTDEFVDDSDSSNGIEVVNVVSAPRIKTEYALTEPSSSEEEVSFCDDNNSDSDLPPSGISEPYFYNENPRLPVFKSGLTQGMATKEVVEELLSITDESPVATAVPCDIKHNTTFIVDTWSLKDMWDVKCDDMGSWTNQGRKNFKKGTLTNHYDTYRQSYTNATLPSLKKYFIYLQNEDTHYRYMFVQYVFTAGESQLTLRPHGNTRKDQKPYKRTMASTMKAIKDEKAKPREVMHAVIEKRGGIDSICSSGEYPRNRDQIYRARRKDRTAQEASNGCLANDPLVQLLEISKQQQRETKADWFVRDVNISNEQTIFLANEQQLLDVERFCTNPESFSVFSVDATFNVSDYYFTFGTYRNLMLETSKGINPVCIGPGVLHKRKLQSSYYTLPSSIVKYRPETKGVLVIGTDGEENLWNALCSVFTDAVHLRCDMHLKDNVKRKLLELNINSNAGREITRDIFGLESESCREGGLVDCQSETEYSEALEVIKKRWPPLHENAKSFLEYFLAGPAKTINDSMRADIRSMCGLGFPPVTYTQNASECLNRYVKENARNPANVSRSLVEAVANIQSVVKRQFDEQYLAVLGKGCYQLAEGFKHLGVEEHNYYQMSDSQKKKTRKQFFEATMSNPKKPRNVDVTNDKEEELSFGPEKTGIISVSYPILESVFSKAKKMRKHVWKLHGVDDTWMTPSSSNPRSPHTVKLSSSGRVSCDKDCPGYNAYFICAHTVAVADKAGTLTDFVKWHRKEKGGTNLTALANVGIPSSSGKKSTTSSKRKGAANKKPSNAPTVSSRLTCRETSTHPKPSRPVPAFGSFAIASMKFLDSKVSVCYGCGQTLKPERKIPEEPGDLVIVGITRRKYWKDGVEMTSSQMSNVYYHLNPNCAAKQNTFVIPALVKVPEDLKPFLNSKHIELLRERLNVTVTQE